MLSVRDAVEAALVTSQLTAVRAQMRKAGAYKPSPYAESRSSSRSSYTCTSAAAPEMTPLHRHWHIRQESTPRYERWTTLLLMALLHLQVNRFRVGHTSLVCSGMVYLHVDLAGEAVRSSRHLRFDLRLTGFGVSLSFLQQDWCSRIGHFSHAFLQDRGT